MPSRSGEGGAGAGDLGAFIRNIPDFPVPGIQFKDISPLLAAPQAFRTAVERMAEPFRGAGVTRVAGIEARGFLFAAGIALELGAGLVMLRKPGKLPSAKVTMTYALEYGSDAVEVHQDAVGPSDRVLIVDDLVATGGTLRAARRLMERLGAGVAGFALLIELEELKGRKGLDDLPFHVLLRF
jgi:adenine phosphoribosyltransferase